MRTARVERTTKESKVLVELNLDGSGQINVDTGVPFFDHMLSQLGKHSGFDLTVKTEGDVDVDSHHTVEDTSLAFGQALREALGDKAGIRRFGDAMVPLDEVLVQAAVDLSGRPYLVHRQPEIVELIGTFDTTLGKHIFVFLKDAMHTTSLKRNSRLSLAHSVMQLHLMDASAVFLQQRVHSNFNNCNSGLRLRQSSISGSSF
jgi:imidazoleglycerol-phosphate dehydratase